nr:uncharacterized protein LOC129439891 [Misgurnus anguillicaudatus]
MVVLLLICLSPLIHKAKRKFSISDKDLILQDDTGVEVDEDVFTDLLEERSNNILWKVVDKDSECQVLDSSSQTDTLSLSSETDDSAGPSSKRPRFDEAFEAKQFIRGILEENAGGPAILAQYSEQGKFTDSTRRHLVNVVVAHITGKEGRVPSKETKTRCALGIVTLFPSLKDPYSRTGYILQDFDIKFGTETASRLLEQWDSLKPKIIAEAKTLTSTLHLNSLISAAECKGQDDSECQGWDNDMSSVLLLAYLLPLLKRKFSISDKDLILQDDTGVEVDEDVFTDLLEERSDDILWKVVDKDSGKCCQFILLPECQVLDSSSQTDTLSLSSETDDSAGPSSKRPRFDEAFEAKQFIRGILEENAGGPAILAQYSEQGKFTDSTRRHLVNVVVAHITGKEGRVPSKETKTRCALGIVTLFPSLKDPYSRTGYILQDFDIKFGTETASRLLEQWDSLKPKIIAEAKTLTSTLHLNSLISAAECKGQDDSECQGWDNDMSSVLLLAYLLPPAGGGRNKSTKISTREAMDHISQFHKVGMDRRVNCYGSYVVLCVF